MTTSDEMRIELVQGDGYVTVKAYFPKSWQGRSAEVAVEETAKVRSLQNQIDVHLQVFLVTGPYQEFELATTEYHPYRGKILSILYRVRLKVWSDMGYSHAVCQDVDWLSERPFSDLTSEEKLLLHPPSEINWLTTLSSLDWRAWIQMSVAIVATVGGGYYAIIEFLSVHQRSEFRLIFWTLLFIGSTSWGAIYRSLRCQVQCTFNSDLNFTSIKQFPLRAFFSFTSRMPLQDVKIQIVAANVEKLITGEVDTAVPISPILVFQKELSEVSAKKEQSLDDIVDFAPMFARLQTPFCACGSSAGVDLNWQVQLLLKGYPNQYFTAVLSGRTM